jgi:hypothetical protein
MKSFVDHPAVLFVVLVLLFSAAVALGAFVLRTRVRLSDDQREDFNVVQGATFTLLALIIGFSLSMAVNRYDQRKNFEEAEANAIGTEYARADLAEGQLTVLMKGKLLRYAQLRLAEYRTRDPAALSRLARETGAIQVELWNLATQVAKDKPTPIGATIVTGMNDVLNSQDYSEAARINRIPLGAWLLMILIGASGCVIQGYGSRGSLRKVWLLMIMPLTLSLSLALISDIDSPRGGLIHVQPQNLTRLLHSLEA